MSGGPPEEQAASRVEAIRWRDRSLSLLDQRALPGAERWLDMPDVEHVARAIGDLVVRGAPAIGIAAAYAAVIGARARGADRAGWEGDLDRLVAARPTAVNLRWAVERMREAAGGEAPGPVADELERTACRIHAEDLEANQRMAEIGSLLLEPGSRVLTHCNTGSLATSGIGTALGVIVRAWRDERLQQVYACETRPWFQGLRLTAWELSREGVPCSVLVEGAAAGLLAGGGVDWVITGADRICANGDVANKVGTLMLAALARQFGARMMVVAPVSTLDPDTASGTGIEIEQRPAAEIWGSIGLAEPPAGTSAWNPVFDVTPADLVDVIVTERGALERPFGDSVARLARRNGTAA
ncbi:MAG: S-methyl-5-thioribose-1-phosphate isomerase [Wenzhouxiangellaceae bacterium]|nr:S-methyl-5-thioribose-1-phosphate isomerase [Wenzhouxiangellaceae bacterium]